MPQKGLERPAGPQRVNDLRVSERASGDVRVEVGEELGMELQLAKSKVT